MQREIKELDDQLAQLEKHQEPKVEATGAEIERLERDISLLKKKLDQFEIQKLAIEQNFIEQNYLGKEDSPPQGTINLNSYAILNERSPETTSFMHEDFSKTLKTNLVEAQINDDFKKSTWRNLELSPIKDDLEASMIMTQKKDPFYDNLQNFKSVGSIQPMSSVDEYINTYNSSQSLTRPQYIRKTANKSTQEENPIMNPSHRRFESVPNALANVKGSASSIKSNNNFNVSISKLVNSSMETKQDSNESYKPRLSNVTRPIKNEEDYMNMPLQKHRSSQSLSDPLNQQPTHNYRVSPELNKMNLTQAKTQESAPKINGAIPLKTIDEEQGTYRDGAKNLKRLSFLAPQQFAQTQGKVMIMSYKDHSKRQQSLTLRKNPSLGQSTLEGTAATDQNNSFLNTQSIDSFAGTHASAYRTLNRNYSSSKGPQSTLFEKLNESSSRNSGIHQTISMPGSSHGTRSRSLGAPNKNLSFEGSVEEHLGDTRTLSKFSNYQSVPYGRQEALIRHIQERSLENNKHPSTSNLRGEPQIQDSTFLEMVN